MYGQKIRELRKKRGITQARLSTLSGVNRAAICLYELDKVEIPAGRLIAIARALNVSIFELTGYEKELDPAEIQRQIKKVPLDRLLESIREKLAGMEIDDATRARAIRFLELLHGKDLEPWQVESIKAILSKGAEKK